MKFMDLAVAVVQLLAPRLRFSAIREWLANPRDGNARQPIENGKQAPPGSDDSDGAATDPEQPAGGETATAPPPEPAPETGEERETDVPGDDKDIATPTSEGSKPKPPQDAEATGNTDATPENGKQAPPGYDDSGRAAAGPEQPAGGVTTTTPPPEPPPETGEEKQTGAPGDDKDVATPTSEGATSKPPQNAEATGNTDVTPENGGQSPPGPDDSDGAAPGPEQPVGGGTTTTPPRDIPGRREKPPRNPVEPRDNGAPSFTPRPELICREHPGEWRWETLLSVPPDCDHKEVLHNGTALFADNGEYVLLGFSGRMTVERDEGEPYAIPLFDGKPLIFKLSNGWKGDGRKVSGITKGHFIVIAPREWIRRGDIPVEPQECIDNSFLAHFFYADPKASAGEMAGFKEFEGPLTQARFELLGERLFDDSGNGELFVGVPPHLRPTADIVWARVGEEKKDGFGKNFKPADASLEDVLNGRQGRFYVRVYDKAQLVDSGEFRYCKDLKEIRMNGEPYSRDMLLAPSSGGHEATTLQFVGVDRANIHPGSNDNSHAIIREDGGIEVAPRPDGDETTWTLCPESGGVDVQIKLPRIWWRLEHNDSHSDGWRDTPLVMTPEEFHAHAETDAVVRLRVPSYMKSFRTGFGDDLSRTLQVKAGLPLNDFVDDEEVDRSLQEDAVLRIQCSGAAVLTLIRITADPPPPPPDPPFEPCQPKKTPYAQVNRAGGWRRGKGFSRRELLDAGLAAGDAARLGVPIDRRRRSNHRINVDNLNRARDHALRTRH